VRILIVSHRYPPHGMGGVERLSEQTAEDLAGAGHDVMVFTRRQSAAPPLPRLERARHHGIPVVMASGGGALQGRFPGPEARMERLFERTVLEWRPDVVLLSHMIGHSPMYVSIAHRWAIPVVVEVHDFYVACERAHLDRLSGELCNGPEAGRACAAHCFPTDERGLERWGLRTHVFRMALEQADAVLCPSRFVADYLERHTAGAVSPTVIGNGVDLHAAAAVRTPSDELRLACLGAIVEHKGPHVVVEALRRAGLPKVSLTLFGNPIQPYVEELVKAAEKVPGLTLRTFGGFDPVHLPLLLADIDLVIVPSLVWETYSIVSREAMACGVPVIASRLGALPEAVRDGENGLLFEPGASNELALILRDLDGDRSRIDALRAGILEDDWISVRDRGERLERLLAELVRHGVSQQRASAMVFDELRAVRDWLNDEALTA
jgi:glycosyltransferase involved in cell wall biosynthesis